MEKVKVNDENLSYNSRIEKEKDRFKQEVMKYNTKEDRLLYIKQQKHRYSILKENSIFTNAIIIVMSFVVLISIILLLEKTRENIFITSLIFTLIIINICISIILMLNLKNVNTEYLITLFALDELEYKINGTLGGSESEMMQLKEVIKNLSTEIQNTKNEVKEGYAMIDQKFYEMKNR